jgi:hypothetical protein
MRLKLFLLLSTLSACAWAADNARQMQPAPPPPSLDAAGGKDAAPAVKSGSGKASSAEEPQVTITKETGQTIEEYRVGGHLYMIKITPAHGKPYYLVDDRGDGKFVRQDSLDNGFRVPRWIIHRF